MHYKIIVKMISALAVILALFMIPSIITAAAYDDAATLNAFFFSFLVIIIPALILLVVLRNSKSKLSVKDGFFLVTVAWISISFLAAIPFYYTGVFTSWADCLFEATSGITTTGATVMVDIESSPESILLWRSVTHWLGGVGIVVLSIALLPILGIGGLQLFRAEATGLDADQKVTPRIAQTAKMLWVIYASLTFISFLALKFAGMDTFGALNHAMSSIASGGFSTKNLSVGYYQSPVIQWIIIISMFAAGVNFYLYFSIISGKCKNLLNNSEFKAYTLIILIFGAIISYVNYSEGTYTGVSENIRHAFFQVVSILTSTGFASDDYEKWPYLPQLLLLICAFIGGCAGSTSGGFKVIRLVVMLKQSLNEIKRVIHPRGIFSLRINGNSAGKEVVYNVFGFFILYIFTIAIVSIITATHADLLTSITTGIAMVGNIGPGFELVGPVDNYEHLPDYIKYVLSFGMLVGRLEIYTFFALLTPYFWKKFK